MSDRSDVLLLEHVERVSARDVARLGHCGEAAHDSPVGGGGDFFAIEDCLQVLDVADGGAQRVHLAHLLVLCTGGHVLAQRGEAQVDHLDAVALALVATRDRDRLRHGETVGEVDATLAAEQFRRRTLFALLIGDGHVKSR